jgi:phospholipid/cholesterol/gamma-HCH transport system substrate-binding protein
MARNKTNHIKLGLFVIAAIILFTYGVYRIADRQELFGDTIELYADFQDVKGLRPGNRVRFSGINIGTVEEVSIIADTTLRVRMEVSESVATYLKTNAQAEVSTDGLVGNMIINISPVNGRADLVENGDFLPLKKKAEIPEMLETLAASNTTIEMIAQQLLEITQKMNEGSGSLSVLLNDERIAENLLITTQNLQTATQQINDAVGEIDQLVDQVAQGEGNLGYLLSDNTLEGQIENLSTELDSLISIRTLPILENLTTSSEAIELATRDVQGLFDQLENEENLVNTLLNDSIISQDLRGTMQNLHEGMQKFNENMEALESNWLFRKYYKKKAKAERKEGS